MHQEREITLTFVVGNFRFALHECLLLQSLGEQTPSEGMLCVGHMPEQIISNPLNV